MRMGTQFRSTLVAVAMAAASSMSAAQEQPPPATAWPGTVGVSLDASFLLGLGISVGVPLGDRFNVRAVHHQFSYDNHLDEDGANYDSTIDLRTTGLMADWHLFKGAFRLTAGLLSNGNRIEFVATDDGNGRYNVGDCTYESDPSDPLRIDGDTKFASTAPYFGLGWGGNMNAGPGFYGLFDLGVMLSGSPDTRMKGSGSARNTGGAGSCGDGNYHDVSGYQPFKDEISKAENDFNESTDKYRLWPSVAFGIGWRF